MNMKSEQYERTDLFKELKLLLSNLDQFEIESLVIMLNTSKRYKLKDLYDKLKIFNYEHSEELVKHLTFADLQYDCLLDLISSCYLYSDEIDILTSVLIWHTSNLINNPDMKLDKENETEEAKKDLEPDEISGEHMLEEHKLTTCYV